MISTDVTLAILAGGQARRMGGQDKGLVLLNKKPLVEHVLDSVPDIINQRLIIANRHINQYAQWGYPVYPDVMTGFLGPLAGIHSALFHAKTPYVLCLACDTPLLPHHLAIDLYQVIQNSSVDACSVFDGKRHHPHCLLLARSYVKHLAVCLTNDHLRLQAWLQSIEAKAVDFSADKSCFLNINNLLELKQLEQ